MSCTDPPLFQNKPLEYRIQPDALIKVTTDTPRFVLGYWSIRGLGAPLRMMLCAARAPHWVALYHVKGDKENWNKESWINDKGWMSKEFNPFTNLPFLIDTQTQNIICQTNAIFSYLGKEFNMLGLNKTEAAKCEEFLCELYDLRDIMVGFAYQTFLTVDAATDAAAVCIKNGMLIFHKFEAYLKRGDCTQGYLVGNTLTAPDFHLYELYCQFYNLNKHYYTLDKLFHFPLLYAHIKTFESLKENQMYLNSPELYQNLPFNNPYAHFGGSAPMTNGMYSKGGLVKEKGTALLEYSTK